MFHTFPLLLSLLLLSLFLSFFSSPVVSSSSISSDSAVDSSVSFFLSFLNVYTSPLYYTLDTLHSHSTRDSKLDFPLRQEEIRSIPFRDSSGRVVYRQMRLPVERMVPLLIQRKIDLDLTVKLSGGPDMDDNADPYTVRLLCIVATDGEGFRSIQMIRTSKEEILAETQSAARGISVLKRLRLGPAVLNSNASTASSSSFSLMSVNVWNYNYWFHRLPLIQSELATRSPSFIGFQEVRTRSISSLYTECYQRAQIQQLFELLPDYEFVYEPAMGFREWANQGEKEVAPPEAHWKHEQSMKFEGLEWRDPDYRDRSKGYAAAFIGEGHGMEFVQEGLAIFSQHPIRSVNSQRLSRDPADGQDFHQRLLQHAEIDWIASGATPASVHLLNTHLSLSRAARDRTLRETGRHIRASHKSLTQTESEDSQSVSGSAAVRRHGYVFVGDFNSLDVSNEIGMEELETQFGMKDAWKTLESAKPQGNLSTVDRYTFNSWDMKSRIDYLFYFPSLEPVSFDIVGESSFPLDEPLAGRGGVEDFQGKMYPSDHRFIHAVMKFPAQQALTGEADAALNQEQLIAGVALPVPVPAPSASAPTPSPVATPVDSHSHEEL